MHYFPPLRREHFYLAWLYIILPYVAYEGSCDACSFHGFQVMLYSFHREIVAHPVPVYCHSVLFRHLLEFLLEHFCPCGCGRETAQAQQSQGYSPCYLIHPFLFVLWCFLSSLLIICHLMHTSVAPNPYSRKEASWTVHCLYRYLSSCRIFLRRTPSPLP